jgi:beta-lactamase regulating signal transducer with metallopeptidase domain
MTPDVLLVRAIGWALLQFLWQGTAIGIVLVAALALLRRRSARSRYAVSCVALTLMVAAPLVTAATEYTRLQRDAAAYATAVAVVAAPIGAAAPSSASQPVGTPLAPHANRTTGVIGNRFNVAFSWSISRRQIDTWLPTAVLLWLGGVMALSARLLGGWIVAERLRRRFTRDIAPDLQARIKPLVETLGIRRRVRILESPLVDVPTMIGWLRPVVLLPAGVVTGLPTQQLDAIVAHELAHIARHDFIVNLAQTAVETLLFFHPAVWWVSHQIRVEREHCCDDVAVRVCGDRVAYARALASLEEFRITRMALALSAAGGALMNRVQRVLGVSEPRTRQSRGGAALCLALGIAALTLAVSETPRAQTAPTSAQDRARHLREANEVVRQSTNGSRDVSAQAQAALERLQEVQRKLQQNEVPREIAPSDDYVPAKDLDLYAKDFELYKVLSQLYEQQMPDWSQVIRVRDKIAALVETQVGYSVTNGRFHHNDSGIEFAVPQGWTLGSVGRSSDEGDGAMLISPSGEPLQVWMIRTAKSPEGMRAASADDWYRHYVGMKIRQRFDGGLRDYWVSPANINQRMIGRTMGLTAIGEYTDRGAAGAEYLAWINGPTSRIFFYGRGPAETLPQRQALYEMVVDTAIVP